MRGRSPFAPHRSSLHQSRTRLQVRPDNGEVRAVAKQRIHGPIGTELDRRACDAGLQACPDRRWTPIERETEHGPETPCSCEFCHDQLAPVSISHRACRSHDVARQQFAAVRSDTSRVREYGFDGDGSDLGQRGDPAPCRKYRRKISPASVARFTRILSVSSYGFLNGTRSGPPAGNSSARKSAPSDAKTPSTRPASTRDCLACQSTRAPRRSADATSGGAKPAAVAQSAASSTPAAASSFAPGRPGSFRDEGKRFECTWPSWALALA